MKRWCDRSVSAAIESRLVKVVWRASARADLRRHLDYTRQRSPQGAKRIRRRILKRIGDLLDFPDSGSTGRAQDVRELVVTQTPYIVVFQREAQLITILAIFHHAQER